MPDVARRRPNWLEDPDVSLDDDVIKMQDGETSIRAAKLRLYGPARPKIDPNRERVRCNAAALDGPSCWSEAHETVTDALGDPYDLCPPHAADLRAVVDEIEAEEAALPVTTVTPERYRTCGVEGCTNWAHECPDHESAAGDEYRKAQRAQWRTERGLTIPREEMPSRKNRSAEYAKANAKRRAERAARA